jgi:FtsH-binding integral membrane protein
MNTPGNERFLQTTPRSRAGKLARMSTRTPGEDLPVRRIDRVLAFMSLGLAVVSIVCFFAVIAARPLGVDDLSQGVWPIVVVFPLIGLPIAFLVMIALLIMSFVRRARANRGR